VGSRTRGKKKRKGKGRRAHYLSGSFTLPECRLEDDEMVDPLMLYRNSGLSGSSLKKSTPALSIRD